MHLASDCAVKSSVQGKDLTKVEEPQSPGKVAENRASAMDQYIAATKLFELAKVSLRQFKADRPLSIDLWM